MKGEWVQVDTQERMQESIATDDTERSMEQQKSLAILRPGLQSGLSFRNPLVGVHFGKIKQSSPQRPQSTQRIKEPQNHENTKEKIRVKVDAQERMQKSIAADDTERSMEQQKSLAILRPGLQSGLMRYHPFFLMMGFSPLRSHHEMTIEKLLVKVDAQERMQKSITADDTAGKDVQL